MDIFLKGWWKLEIILIYTHKWRYILLYTIYCILRWFLIYIHWEKITYVLFKNLFKNIYSSMIFSPCVMLIVFSWHKSYTMKNTCCCILIYTSITTSLYMEPYNTVAMEFFQHVTDNCQCLVKCVFGMQTKGLILYERWQIVRPEYSLWKAFHDT